MSSPYQDLPSTSFWRTGVSNQTPQTVEGLYKKKFAIAPADVIVTAGSCFAQHIARRMTGHGYSVLDVEPPPPGLNEETAKKFGYRLYSARYGNIYTCRQLLQLIQEALRQFTPADAIWEKDGRYYDALRPSVEPNGLPSPEHVKAHRDNHLRHVRDMLRKADVFVFTFGLTETWIHTESGTVYPTAPGTIAGRYDPAIHSFKNFEYDEIVSDFLRVRRLLQKRKPSMRFLVTVSPVPLTATAAPEHVLAATTYSKSVLRAAAGKLARDHADIDYFPSYEMIASPFSKGAFFEPNLRSVAPEGVDAVMRVFFSEHAPSAGASKAARSVEKTAADLAAEAEDVVCEEQLLEAFAR